MRLMTEIQVSVADQRLSLTNGVDVVKQWSISTSLNGVGNQSGSNQTPLGHHRIRACIGRGVSLNSVFIGRRLTGEIYSKKLASEFPERDWILTRILWLCGEEKGINRGSVVDSQRRYIYIHGTPDSEPMGVPLSHGCIRMRNLDIIELFEQVGLGTNVVISET